MDFNALFKPIATNKNGRKVWSIDLQTTWLPFLIAKNTEGVTHIPLEALGAPIRLAYNEDGTVKFTKRGLPVTKLAKELADSITMIRLNFESGLKEEAHRIATENTDAYNAIVRDAVKAGLPIQQRDISNRDKALAKLVADALAHAEAEAKVKAEAEAKIQAEAEAKIQAEADGVADAHTADDKDKVTA
jgi:hypothetical protein